MAHVENAIGNDRMCPVWTASLHNTELAYYVEGIRHGFYKSYHTTTLVIAVELAIGCNDRAFAFSLPSGFVIGLTCVPVYAAPVTCIVVNPVRAVDIVAYEYITAVMGVESLCAPYASNALQIVSELELEAVDVIALTEEYLTVTLER
jgi:hypothetical protein